MIRRVATDDEDIIGLADPDRDQYFLSAPDKLELLVRAAGIRPTDHVVEIGAGIGSVARALPPCASLTLIELDERFTDVLRRNVPHATVIQGDAFQLLLRLPCDVLLSNLPTVHTDRVLGLLPNLGLRTAVVTASQSSAGVSIAGFAAEPVVVVSGDDFRPPQPIHTHLVRISRSTQPSRPHV
jgi:hypothetical protein